MIARHGCICFCVVFSLALVPAAAAANKGDSPSNPLTVTMTHTDYQRGLVNGGTLAEPVKGLQEVSWKSMGTPSGKPRTVWILPRITARPARRHGPANVSVPITGKVIQATMVQGPAIVPIKVKRGWYRPKIEASHAAAKAIQFSFAPRGGRRR